MLDGLVAFPLAVCVGTLFEYVVHRLMHCGKVLGRKHAEHHRDGWGQGFLGEFVDYLKGAAVLGWAGFLYSVPAGIGFAAGAVTYAAFAAYAHQVQHERPELVFWLRRPVHHLHHKHHMWRHNFGIAVDIWDRVFGTYKVADWQRDPQSARPGLRSYLHIKWY